MKSAGKYSALALTILTAITFAIAILTPPMSGPLCQSDCFKYPYTDAISRFPRDYYWMYPAIFICLIFIFVLICTEELSTSLNRKFARAATGFGLISAGALITIYFLQLSVIQPSLLTGETEGLAILSQFNPHGLFIAMEEIGYLLMSLSLACLFPLFTGKTWEEKLIRWAVTMNFILSIGSLLFFTFKYGHQREYLFEIAIITSNWLTLVLVGIGLTKLFKDENNLA